MCLAYSDRLSISEALSSMTIPQHVLVEGVARDKLVGAVNWAGLENAGSEITSGRQLNGGQD